VTAFISDKAVYQALHRGGREGSVTRTCTPWPTSAPAHLWRWPAAGWHGGTPAPVACRLPRPNNGSKAKQRLRGETMAPGRNSGSASAASQGGRTILLPGTTATMFATRPATLGMGALTLKTSSNLE